MFFLLFHRQHKNESDCEPSASVHCTWLGCDRTADHKIQLDFHSVENIYLHARRYRMNRMISMDFLRGEFEEDNFITENLNIEIEKKIVDTF